MRIKSMDKKFLIHLPSELYETMKKVAAKRYKSVSELIRESVLEKIEEEFTPEDMTLIEKGRKSFHAGKGLNWRKVKRV